jgi:hypothetical protein
MATISGRCNLGRRFLGNQHNLCRSFVAVTRCPGIVGDRPNKGLLALRLLKAAIFKPTHYRPLKQKTGDAQSIFGLLP